MTTKTDRGIVDAATPGPWDIVESGCYYYFQPPLRYRMGHRRKENAHFIERFNPTKVSAMLDRIDELEKRNTTLLAERNSARWELCLTHVEPGGYMQYRGWDCFPKQK